MAKLVKGDKFPNYTVDTVYESGKTIEQLMDGKPTMFWFQRYIGCPPCRLDVHLLMNAKPQFDEKGVNIIIVMQSKPEIVKRDMGDQTLPFHLICDPTESLYKDLEIGSMDPDNRPEMNEEERKKMAYKMQGITEMGIVHGDYEGNERQLPAFFYVDKDMTVLEAHYAKNIADMPLAAEALAKIK